MKNSTISIKDLDFRYARKPLFRGLTIDFEPGKIYGLLGKNGAGKTSLFKIAAGLLHRNVGSCAVLGMDSGRRHPAMLENLMFIPECFHMPRMNITAYMDSHARLYPGFDHALFNKLINEYELDTEQKIRTLSHGQRKKVILAFGIASGCRVLLLDEPTNGLDIPSKRILRRHLAGALSEDRTIIIATHQVREIENIFDTVVIIDNGRILLNSAVYDLASRFSVKLVPALEACPGALYHEPVPGGFSVIIPNDGTDENNLELEFIFNALLAGGGKMAEMMTPAETV